MRMNALVGGFPSQPAMDTMLLCTSSFPSAGWNTCVWGVPSDTNRRLAAVVDVKRDSKKKHRGMSAMISGRGRCSRAIIIVAAAASKGGRSHSDKEGRETRRSPPCARPRPSAPDTTAVAEQVADSREGWRRSLTRRQWISALPVLAAAIWPVPPSWATIDVDQRVPLGNTLLRGFGLGDSDIYYPSFFAGTWNCDSTLIAVETPQGDAKIDKASVDSARKRIGYTTTYQARFVPFQGFVVCDRLFTTVSLVESIIGKDTIEHGSWSPRQPNRLELILKGGLKVENTVTKRSSGMFSPYEFESAEFSRQVFDNSVLEDGPPTVKASQNLTRYQWDSSLDKVVKIRALQKVSMYAVPKEGQDYEGMEMFDTTSPVTVYKYRIFFNRQEL